MLNYDGTSLTEATEIQNTLRHSVSLITANKNISTIAGGDISHNKDTDVVYAGIVILSYPQMQLLSYSIVEAKTTFPYVPGFLGFREVPSLLHAWKQIPTKPDLMILDGQGVTHPRQMGIASHFGVLTDHPSIGCAKNMLYGNYKPLGLTKFSSSEIISQNEHMGYAVRTKNNVKPVYISPGHKISVADSLELIKPCILKHRIPEPTRLAHEKVNLFRVGKLKAGYHTVNIQGELF
ncbi:deoxyribonuclease V [Flavobacterium sp. DG1-102-2]|uniref:deoxyribonuclease V n=1 Tax=Flavobacterium sp. DG1-102-2 TaxID=3081663 RepID=UPI002948C612|nr:deoxyribonuclease V [Flavobacterium sp. DG1-102-2]MDV6167036.1 deoxyribonuclease V [Flavobacterium sp. DG1-102-2]